MKSIKDFSFLPSRVERFLFKDKEWFIKRDDLIDLRFSGNKLRKLYTLLQTNPNKYTTLISFGGVQSNAMLSLAHLCKIKGWEFIYYVKKMPKWLKANPIGNLKLALELGMKIVEISHLNFYDYIDKIRNNTSKNTIFIPQGGASKIAKEGIQVLAKEILSWKEDMGLDSFCVATPSGTGTTALYLRQYLPKKIDVVTASIVGDKYTLYSQWNKLEPNVDNLPKILDKLPKHPFAKPKKEYFDIWLSLRESGIEFDLIYAPKMWLELIESYNILKKPILYIHSGGTIGNISQIEQYRYKGIFEISKIS